MFTHRLGKHKQIKTQFWACIICFTYTVTGVACMFTMRPYLLFLFFLYGAWRVRYCTKTHYCRLPRDTTLISPLQYIPRNMHTVFALLCFVVVIHWLIFPYPSGLLHWHCGNLTIAPVPAKQPWWIWINTSCEFIMNDCFTTTKQSTTKPCAYFLGYTVCKLGLQVT